MNIILKLSFVLSLIVHNVIFWNFSSDYLPENNALSVPKLPLENNIVVSLKHKNNNTTKLAKKQYYSEFEDTANLLNLNKNILTKKVSKKNSNKISKNNKNNKKNKNNKNKIAAKITNKNKNSKKNNQNLAENLLANNNNDNSNNNVETNNSTIIYTPPQWENVTYLNNPPPEYPEISQQRGEQGTVKIKAIISDSGNVLDAVIWKSSKFARLDFKALETIKKWKFVPAKSNQQNIQAEVIIPIRFILNNA